MCVAIPLKVRQVLGKKAIVESFGVLTEANISLVRSVEPGDYLLVHAGFAIAKMQREEAENVLEVWQMALAEEP